MDFTVNLGYRWGMKTSDWKFSVVDESFSAFWINEAPAIDNTGWVLSLGFKIYVF